MHTGFSSSCHLAVSEYMCEIAGCVLYKHFPLYGKYNTSKMILSSGDEQEWPCIADLMFCHGTQTTDSSKICHCLLFHEHVKQNFMQSFIRWRKLLWLHPRLTKLHNEVTSWISGAYECHYAWPLPKANSTTVIWPYRLWAACPCLSWSTVTFSRSIGMELDSEDMSIVSTYIEFWIEL